jgi:hypothetical protein
MANDYTVIRIDADRLRLDRVMPPGFGAVAFIVRVRDRDGTRRGWSLKPLVTMRGSPSKVWPRPEEALASTTLLTIAAAKAVIRKACPTEAAP